MYAKLTQLKIFSSYFIADVQFDLHMTAIFLLERNKILEG